MNRRTTLRATVAVALTSSLGLAALPAQAEFPEKPVEMTVLFGGTANSIAQLLSELMSEELGQPVVPVSRTGGGGAVGYSYVMGTRPDGYNIVWNSNSISTSHHTGKIPFDYTAFKPIARVSTEVPALAVNAKAGWETLDDLKAALEEGGEPLKVGISGKGSFTHLTSAALFEELEVGDQVSYIPYGDGKAPVELLAGRIDAAIQWPGQFVSYEEAGDLNVIAVTGGERVDVLPDVATAQEQGYDLDITMWRGLAAPANTPDEVIQKLEAAAKAVTENEAFKKASANIGFHPTFAGHEDFRKAIAADDEFYGELLSELGMAQ